MANIGFLLAGALGVAVGVQTLDRPESSRPLRAATVVVMAIAFLVANLAVLAQLSS
jgi:hypothetical protein